jgi:hypothetical protein
MRFSAEIWRRSEHIQALGNFSKLIGEKSPIRCQRVKNFRHATVRLHIDLEPGVLSAVGIGNMSLFSTRPF